MWRHSRLPSDQAVRRVVVGWSRVVGNGGRSDQRDNVQRWRWIAVTPCAPSAEPVFFPLDEELELLPGELSATLAEGVARQGTKMPLAQAAAGVAFFWGGELDETTVPRYTAAGRGGQARGASAEPVRAGGRPPAGAAGAAA